MSFVDSVQPTPPLRFVLTLTCADRPGIVHAVCSALLEIDGNIVESAQHGDVPSGLFCLRTEFETTAPPGAVQAALGGALAELGGTLSVAERSVKARVLILVSKVDHCLVDLIYRSQAGRLPIEIVGVVSNHTALRRVAEAAGLPFWHVPVAAATKAAAEARLFELVDEHRVDLVVLARYMQVLSDDACARLDGRAINIHHSFLPGFAGAKPYHQAFERGVKLVGATAHFVTADLDEGPIIEQDVIRVSHAEDVSELTVLGQDVERTVLSRAVRLWAEHRVLVVDGRTVVFP